MLCELRYGAVRLTDCKVHHHTVPAVVLGCRQHVLTVEATVPYRDVRAPSGMPATERLGRQLFPDAQPLKVWRDGKEILKSGPDQDRRHGPRVEYLQINPSPDSARVTMRITTILPQAGAATPAAGAP